MLEPLIMGELCYAKTDSDINIELINCLLKFLNTTQISKKLISQLMKRNLYNSAWKLIDSCPQFTQEDKDQFLVQLQKAKSTFELIYGVHNTKTCDSKTKLSPTLEEEIMQKFSEEWEYNFGINFNEKVNHKHTVESLDLFNTMNIDK